MADRPQLRIDAPKKITNRAKAVAYMNGQSLTEFVLRALAKTGDKELTQLIEAELEERAGRGRPQNQK